MAAGATRHSPHDMGDRDSWPQLSCSSVDRAIVAAGPGRYSPHDVEASRWSAMAVSAFTAGGPSQMVSVPFNR